MEIVEKHGSYVVEKVFEHKGLKCVVVFGDMGHRCGYVGIPKEHVLYGKDYTDYLDITKEQLGDREVSGVITLFLACLDSDEKIRIDAFFTCHGGITYSGQGSYPIESDLWWFGFDCAHYNDGKDLDLAIKYFPEKKEELIRIKEWERPFRSDYVARSCDFVFANCITLAEQLLQIGDYLERMKRNGKQLFE